MAAVWYAFLGLTFFVAVLVAVLVFAVLRFGAAARASRNRAGGDRKETALLSSALEEAITRLREQERATAARAEASKRLSDEIVASLASGLVVVGADNSVQIVNPAARRILSLPDAAPGSDYRELLAGASALADVIAEALRSKMPILRRTVPVDSTVGDDRSQIMHLGVTVSPVASHDGGSAAVCLFTDLTSVFALEEQLRLKDSLARLGELTAGLAHEFRNGLATIHGYGRLLDPALLPETYRPYVQGIRAETQALGEIVTNFLNFAKPEALTLAPLDLRAVIQRAADDSPGADVHLSGEFETIDGDDVLLRQAFSNLFRNSVEAVAARGRTARIAVDGRVDRTGGNAIIDVRDDGPGIPEDALGRVFQPFFTTRANGTGLGLAIVQKVVVSHNGLISAANHANGGAAFRVSFPLRAS